MKYCYQNCIFDILNFLYHKNEKVDYTTFQENTYLQKKIKQEIINGTIFHLGLGILKDDII